MSNAPAPEIKTLPAFMRSQSPGIKFDSPFPPLNPKVRVRGVMERAGFDVYKPSQRVHSSYHLRSSNASSPTASTRNFTAPVHQSNNKTMSDPNFTSRLWKESPVESLTPKLQQRTEPEVKHSPSSSESEPVRIPKVHHASMEFASANSSNTTVTGADLKEDTESFDFGARPRAATVKSNSGLYAPKSLAAPVAENNLNDGVDDDDDDDDYVKQLLNMKKQLGSHEVPDIVVQNDAGVAKPRVFSGDFNVHSPPAPNTFTRFHRDSGMSTTSSVYTMDAGQRVTSVGTMHTNDTKIYNLDVKKEAEADMSAIQELTEDESEIHESFDNMKLDSHSTLEQQFEDAAESFPAAAPSVRTESSFQQTTSDSTLYERNFLAMAGKQQQEQHGASSLSSLSTTTAPQLFPAGEGPCRKCGLPVEDKSIWSKDSQLSGQWHRRCFGCYTCNKPFPKGTSCYVFKDSPYCEQHFHEANGSICQSCSKGIEGQCLETENGSKFHPGCLVCSVCNTSIKEDYYLLGTEIICEQDAMEMRYSGASPTTTSKLERRRTKTIRV